jgi:hypothetical protein
VDLLRKKANGIISLAILVSLGLGCLQGVEAPVIPVNPKPPAKITVDVRDIWLFTVRQTEDGTKHIEQTAVIGDLKFWMTNYPGRWRHYDADTTEGKNLLPAIGSVPLPALVISAYSEADRSGLSVIKVIPVPSTTDEVVAAVKAVVK